MVFGVLKKALVGSIIVGAVIVAVRIRKHGGHITVGIGDKETSWIFDGKEAVTEIINEDV